MKNYFYFFIIYAICFSGCRPLTTESEAFKRVQVGLLETNKTMNDIAMKVDRMADLQRDISEKVGLGTSQYDNQKIVSRETLDLIKQIKEDNAKTYSMFNETLQGILPLLKAVAPIAAQAVGIPAPVTNSALSLTESLLIGGGVGGAVKHFGLDLWARRKREREHQEEIDEKNAEIEKQRQKSLIKQRTMAKINPQYQEEWDRCNAEAISELKAKGEIS